MAERVLVTGGAGFVGSHLVDALVAAGHQVRVLDSLEAQVHGESAGPPQYVNAEAEFTEGSVMDPAVVARALEGVDVVFHEAALVGVGQSMYEIARYCRGNTVGAAVVLDEVVKRRDKIRKLIVASSMSIYGEGAYRDRDGNVRVVALRQRQQLQNRDWEVRDPESDEPLVPILTPESKPLQPTSVYAITKRDHEELFLNVGHAYSIPTVALRYFNIYGARQALSNPYTGVGAIFSSRLLNGRRPVVFEDGRQSRDFVHVSDVVHANMLAMHTSRADYRAINVGTGVPTTVCQVAVSLARLLDVPHLAPEVTGGFREGDIRHCIADISAAKELLGYEPKVKFENGIRDLVEWVRHETAEDRFDQARQELVERGLA